MTDRVGQRLGNYRLIRLLGKGGFAEVYLGEHLRLGTHAAVKVLYTRLATPDETAGFEKEAQTIAHLKHPHIVRVLDFDVQDDTPFLIMDYAVGGTLRHRHPKGSILPLPIVINYVKQVADALQYAHDQKLIHRDVKPENMLVGEREELLLSDFGIALIAQSSRYQGTQDMAGTIAYMAPEQIQGKPRPASDQYALGIAVYEWLSGDRPFHGSYSEVAVQHTITPPPSLREKVPTILSDVEQVVTTALAKEPKERFGSVQAFAKALEQASQDDVPTFIKPPAPVAQPVPVITPPAIPVVQTPHTTIPPDHLPTLPVTPPPKQPVTDVKSLGTVIYTYRGHSDIEKAVAWSPDGQRIASGSIDRTVQVWNATTGRQIGTYRGHSHSVYAVAWSPDGRRIASVSEDKTVQIWDATTGNRVFTYHGHSHSVCAVAWSPDGRRIASGSDDKTVQVWDATTGGHVVTYRGHSDRVLCVAWSLDGRRIASGGWDKTVQVWEAINGGHVFTYSGHSNEVYAMAWSPDGQRIASGSWDKTVQVWDAADGGNSYTYRGHSNRVHAVAWSPDGKRIASGSGDYTVQVWDTSNGGHVFTYRGHSLGVHAVAWSPDGKRIASGGIDRTIQVWVAG